MITVRGVQIELNPDGVTEIAPGVTLRRTVKGRWWVKREGDAGGVALCNTPEQAVKAAGLA